MSNSGPYNPPKDTMSRYVWFVGFLTALKEMGYERVWINNTPAVYACICNANIVATPPRRPLGTMQLTKNKAFPRDWGIHLKNADGMFSRALTWMPRGEYDLTGDISQYGDRIK